MAGILRLNNTSNTGQTTLTSIASTDRTINLPDADGTLLISTLTTQTPLPDGTEAAPGITFANDLDTGIYRPATNEIGLVTGGSEALRIDNTGRVGIGTTDPVAPLSITPAANSEAVRFGVAGSISTVGGGYPVFTSNVKSIGDPFDFENILANASIGLGLISPMRSYASTELGGVWVAPGNAVAGTTYSWSDMNAALTWNTSGNIGINTTVPAALLHVTNTSAQTYSGTAGASTHLFVDTSNSNGNGQCSTIYLRASGNGTTNNARGFINLIQPSSTSNASEFAFQLRNAAGNIFEAMRIDANGNVGIGTNNPTRLLQVEGSDGQLAVIQATAGNSILRIDAQPTAGAEAYLWCRGSTTGKGRLRFGTDVDGDIGQITYDFSTDNLEFTVNANERMRINSTGQVHFGTSTQNTVLTQGSAFAPGSQNRSVLYQGTDSAGTLQLYYTNAVVVGSITTTAGGTSFNETSDYRLKENIVPLTNAIARLNQLSVHRFNFLADPDTTVDGFIAHETQAVVPEAVTGEKDAVDEDGNPEYQGIDKSKLVPLLTAALQEALAEIESLKARVTALEP